MKQKIEKRKLLRVLSICFTVAGLLTVIPYAGAGNVSILGYNALCPFCAVKYRTEPLYWRDNASLPDTFR